jgi:DNA topoisomerase IA
MPHILDEAVKQLKKKGWGTSSAYAIGTSTLQKSGSLKKGTNKPTAKGIKRGKMTQAERRRTA